MPSQRGHHGQGKKHLAPANGDPSGTASHHNKSCGIESHAPGPSPSTPAPSVVITNAPPLESENWVKDIPDPTPATCQQHREHPSPEGLEDFETLLYEYGIEHANGRGDSFWTLSVLEGIVTFQRVVDTLERSGIKEIEAEKIAKTILQPPESRKASYIKIFCILALCGKTSSIKDFLCTENGVCDDDLPLIRTFPNKVLVLQKRNNERRLLCFKEWIVALVECFERYQYRFCPHIFGITDMTKAPHFDLEPEIVLPFMLSGEKKMAPSPSDDMIGAFGEVFKYHIPSDCHGFDEILKKLHLKGEVFAVKKLHRGKVNDWKSFKHETDQLQRFNGRISPHFVTLLATFSQSGEHYFVFPFAEGDLCKYWARRNPPRKMNSAFTCWYARQLLGLIEAISRIHNPDFLGLPQAKFGRHGDIKPDNILWYNSTLHTQGLFVLSDLGLSTLNSDKSKSNIPGQNVPPVPGYRPPECDIEKGKVNRLFDVWTMGCLFLEMITWYLGGEDLREEFDKQRTTTFRITGALTNQFYSLMPSANGEGMFAQFVKPEVTNWIDKLRGHAACTDFVHDIIDIIEKHMIVVLADPPKRSRSKELESLFRDAWERCDKSKRHCESPTPRPLVLGSLDSPTEGVRVKLNGRVRSQMLNPYTNYNTLGVFKGTELRSAGPHQYQDEEQAVSRLHVG